MAAALTASTISGVCQALPRVVSTASPDSSVRLVGFHSAMLSSVCPLALITVQSGAPGSGTNGAAGGAGGARGGPGNGKSGKGRGGRQGHAS